MPGGGKGAGWLNGPNGPSGPGSPGGLGGACTMAVRVERGVAAGDPHLVLEEGEGLGVHSQKGLCGAEGDILGLGGGLLYCPSPF